MHLRYQFAVGSSFEHSSSRVIALGRLMLASLFLVAILVDVSQPARAPTLAYIVFISYLAFAALIVVLTWNNWWLDARLAGPAHGVDIIGFSVIVVLTLGYTSPVVPFFVFILLSAAIRWGWRETAQTAILLTLLYLMAGMLAVPEGDLMEMQHFVVRTGHVVILSLILIWFGVNQWSARILAGGEKLFGDASLDLHPVESGLAAAMSAVNARAGCFVWLETGEATGLSICDGVSARITVPEKEVAEALTTTPFLYDLSRRRGLRRDEERNLLSIDPGKTISQRLTSALHLKEGIAIPMRSEAGEGVLFLERISKLSIDHIDLGEQIANNLAAHFQSHALLKAAEENAAARSRLSLARDLHDSVVQFLAGAAFRLEAIKRSVASGRDVEPDLNELKQLMMQEQGELRAFITALRGSSQIALNEMARDLRSLSARLSRQWGISCPFAARPGKLMVPARIHRDAQQVVREAVANAVRHAGATSVSIELGASPAGLTLEFINDGTGFGRSGEAREMPKSLRERVDQAGGEMEFSRGMGVTKLSVSLPVREDNR